MKSLQDTQNTFNRMKTVLIIWIYSNKISMYKTRCILTQATNNHQMKNGMYKSFDRIRFQTPHPEVSKDDLVSTMKINRASVDRLRL